MLEGRLRVSRGSFELDAAFALEGGITALFGPSGAGKTTLLHAVAGLIPAATGRLALGGRVLLDSEAGIALPPWRRRVGLVFQDLRLFPHRSVLDNLQFGWKRLAAGRRRLEPRDVVEVLELGALLARRPGGLSGGERQRVALGRALLAAPELLLMDEPLAALDVRLRRQILPYLRWVHERFGIPIVYVSHALAEILDLTERVLVIDRGRVAGSGEVFDVLGRTLHGEVAAPFSTESLARVTVVWPHEEGRYVKARIGAQEVILPFAPVSTGTVARVAVRPEDVMLARARLTGVSARNQLEGTVRRVSRLHGRLLVHVLVGEDAVLRAEVTEEAWHELRLQVGDRVVCVVKTSAFRWQS